MTEIVYGLVSGMVGVAIWQLLDRKLPPDTTIRAYTGTVYTNTIKRYTSLNMLFIGRVLYHSSGRTRLSSGLPTTHIVRFVVLL